MRIDLVAEDFQPIKIATFLGGRAHDFFDDHGTGHAAPASRISGVVHGDVVVRDDSLYRSTGHFPRHVEIHHVAFVVLDDEQHARAGIHRLAGGDHLVGCRRREHLPGTGGIEHAATDKAGVQRLMTGPAAGDQPDFAFLEIGAAHEFSLVAERDDVGVRLAEPGQALLQDLVDAVDQFLHLLLPIQAQ